MKVHELRTLLAYLRMLPEGTLDAIAEARFTLEPRDNFDKVLLALAAGEREWRMECRTTM